MNSILKSLVVAVATAVALSSAPITAQAFMGDDGAPQGGRHFKKMATELGLSAQQKQEIKDILKRNHPQTQPMMTQLLIERRALRALVQAEVIDEGAIRTQSAKVATIEADLAFHRAQVAQEMRKVLTPEQVLKFKEIQAKRDRQLDEFASRAGKCLDQEK